MTDMQRPAAEPDDIKPALTQAQQHLQAGKLAEALTISQTLVEKAANNIDAWYMLAVCHRYMNQHEKSLQALEQLLSLAPGYGRAYQEQGHNYLALNQAAQAKQAFEDAVKFNPALHASWRELANIYQQSGDQRNLNRAAAELQHLSSLPKVLLSVSSMIHEDKLYQAEQLCRDFLKKNKTHVEGMRLLADLGIRQFVYDDAEFLLENCVKFEPDNWRARHDYVTILHKRQKFTQALEQAEYLRNKYPGNLAFETSYASQNVALGRHDAALEIYQQVTAQNPQLEMPHLMAGHAYKTIGNLEQGI